MALIAAVAFATFTCGFGVALLAGLAAGLGASALLSLGEAIAKMFSTPTGAIVNGSPNVFFNSKPAAYAVGSMVACAKDVPPQMVATGAATVFVNNMPVARNTDKITCGAKISAGSPDIVIDDKTVQMLPVEDEVPPWLRTAVDWAFALAGLVGGPAGAAKAAGGLSRAFCPCAAKFIAGFAVGEAVSRYVVAPVVSRVYGAIVGHPVDMTSGRKLLLAEHEVDFVVPSPLPIVIPRFYASDLARVGSLGVGGVLPWALRLERRGTQVFYTDAQGRASGFLALEPGQRQFDPVDHRTLSRLADGRYLLSDQNELYRELEPLADHDGTRGGVLVAYGYGESGHLASVRDANGNVVRQFGYEDGRMVRHVNALGLECRYEWALVDGLPRVVAATTSEGERNEFGDDVATRRSWMSDELGRQASREWDDAAQHRALRRPRRQRIHHHV